MGGLAKIILNMGTKGFKKRGSALLLTVLTLAFLLVLLSGFSLDRQLRYWVSSNRRNELVSFYNAQSAYEQAEYDLVQYYTTHGLLENFKKSFDLNKGVCRYQVTVNASELKLEGIGILDRNYSLLQGRYLYFSNIPEYPLLLVSEKINHGGKILLAPSAVDKGLFLPISEIQMQLISGLDLDYLLHGNQEQTNEGFSKQNIKAFELLSESIPEYENSGSILSLLPRPVCSLLDLKPDRVYFSLEGISLDLRLAEERVNLPSLICCQTLEILARPEQIIIARGLLYSENLFISHGTLLIDPSPDSIDCIARNKELLAPNSFEATPQLILARKDLRFIPERAVGE